MSRLMHIVFGFNREKQLNPQTNRREPKGYEYTFRKPWNPEMGIRFNAKVHSRDENCEYAEVSRKLNKRMTCDYVLLTWELSREGTNEVRRLVANGLNSRTLKGYDGPDMVFCFGWTRDGHSKAVFATQKTDLKKLGYHTDIVSLESAVKFEKYIGRQLAPHLYEVEGAIERKADTFDITLDNGAKITAVIRPKNVYNDGIVPMSYRGMQLLCGLEDPKAGTMCGVTAEFPEFIVKGHGVHVPHLKPGIDLVIYDHKPLLKGPQGRFWFGRLRDIHVGRPYMDIQSMINLVGATEAGLDFVRRKVDEANRRTLRAVQNFDALESRFLSRIREKDGQELTWSVERAVELGIHPVFGGLFRSFTTPEMHELYNMPLGRVPIYDEAVYRYVCPDLSIIAPDGSINLRLARLKGNCAFTPGLKGTAAMWRQPNGTQNERWTLELVEAAPFMDWDPNNLYLSADIIPDICEALGTMDFDDAVIVSTSAELVEVFNNLPRYETVEMGKAETAKSSFSVNPYDDEIYIVPKSNVWSAAWFDQRMSMELEDFGVGFWANALMCSILVENGKQSMLEDLAEQYANERDDAKASDLKRRITNLKDWTPSTGLRKLGTRYNDFIDMSKTGKVMVDADEVRESIQEMYRFLAADAAFPWTWTIGGFQGKGRIPATLRRDHQIVTARTPLCHALQEARQSIKFVDVKLMELEWRLCIPCPAELKAAFPTSEEIEAVVSELRQWWWASWDEARKNGNMEDQDPEAFRAAYERIEDELNAILRSLPYDLKTVWVALASRIYKQKWAAPPLDETGNPYHMRDRLLWAGDLAHAGLDAIAASGLAGERAIVHLDAGFKHLAGPYYVPVKSEQGVITLAKDGRVIGYANTPDGDWTMHQGLITVREAAPMFRVTPETV